MPPLRTVSIATACDARRRSPRHVLPNAHRRRHEVDGAPTTVTAAPQPLPGGGTIGTYGTSNEIFVAWPDGSVAIVAAVGIYPQYYRFTVELGLTSGRKTHIVGLLGKADDEPSNDIVTRNGVQLTYPDPPLHVYPTFADSWRISQAESLFDYEPGETTETFTDRTYPDEPATPHAAARVRSTLRRSAACSACRTPGARSVRRRRRPHERRGVRHELSRRSARTNGMPNNTGITAIGTPTTVTIGTRGERDAHVLRHRGAEDHFVSDGQHDRRRRRGRTPAERRRHHEPVPHRTERLPRVFTLPVAGTYTITIDPRNQNTAL